MTPPSGPMRDQELTPASAMPVERRYSAASMATRTLCDRARSGTTAPGSYCPTGPEPLRFRRCGLFDLDVPAGRQVVERLHDSRRPVDRERPDRLRGTEA